MTAHGLRYRGSARNEQVHHRLQSADNERRREHRRAEIREIKQLRLLLCIELRDRLAHGQAPFWEERDVPTSVPARPHARCNASVTPPSVSAMAPISRSPNGSPRMIAADTTPITGTSSMPVDADVGGRRRSVSNQVR